MTAPIRALTVGRAFIRRDWTTARSYRLPFALEVIQRLATLFFLFLLARFVDGRSGPSGLALPGSYFGFVVLGTSTISLLVTTLTVFADRLQTDQSTGTFETLLALPSPSGLTVLASASYGVLYSVVGAAASVAVGIVVFGLEINARPAGFAMAIAAVGAAIVLFSAAGVVFAAFVVVFKRAAVIGLVTSAMTLLGGVYYPVDLLPGPLRFVGQIFPVTWAIDVLRQTLLAGQLPFGKLALLSAAALAMCPLARWALAAALAHARRAGTLGQF